MADKLSLDRIAMKDRSTSYLRIYVGGLTEQTTVDCLYDHFICYGQINGIVINKTFGFVQFESENSAQDAIAKANGTMLLGKSLSVKTAQSNADKAKRDAEKNSDMSQPKVFTDNIGNNDEASDEQYDNYGNYIGDNNQSKPGPGFKDESACQDLEGYGDNYGDNYDNNYGQQTRGGARGGGRGRGEPRGRGRGRGARARGGAAPSYRERSPITNRGGEWAERTAYDRFQKPMEYTTRPYPGTERNDCEIIVVSKALTDYAEYIEDRLKRLGIVVDLLFPMEDVTIGKVLGNIASRGCLYAILVMPQNQENRSITLTILHGLPQEHRNMPLEDALQLLSRNFQEVHRGGSAGREAVYALLGQLADGRTLTVLQYDKVIEYLQDKRQQQVKVELGEPLATNASKDKTQVDLQQRILTILNDKKVAKSEPTLPEPAPAPAPQNKLLSDPTVRKALDSILQKFT